MKTMIASLFLLIFSFGIFHVAKAQNTIDSELCQGVDYALNFEYANALTLLDKLQQENPEDARPYMFKAVVYVQLIVNCQNPDKYKDLFFENINRAEDIAQKLVKKNKEDWSANFILGGVYGWKAKYYLDAGAKWKTFISARKAKGYFEKALKLNPDCFDVYYGLGVYHYYAGTLPKLLRFILPILNFEGDTKRGMRELNLAKDKGKYSDNFATYELVLIYLDKEEKREEGLQMASKLFQKYPKNFNFQLLSAQYYHYLGRDNIARTTIDQLESEVQDEFYAELSDNKKAECHLWSGIVNLALNQNEKAQNDFQTALATCSSDDLKSQAHFLFGLSLNDQKRYQEAYEHYKKSLEHEDYFGSHHKAEEEIKKLKKEKLITEN
jgi:tetratricopeptide (TPR) repeat protein